MQPLPKITENSFNAVRLMAALQVAYVHAIANLHLAPGWGWEWIVQFPGVPIFFAISGYLVFDSLLRLGSLPRFFRHRAARIYPALIVNIAIIEVLLTIAGQSHFVWRDLLFFPVYAATASDGIAVHISHGSGGSHTFSGFFEVYPSGVLWTLTVELTFYAVIPLFAAATSRAWRTVLVTAALIGSFAYQKYLGADIVTAINLPVSVSVIPYFWMFGIGMLFRLWPPPAWLIKPGTMILLAAFAFAAWSRQLIWFEWKVDPSTSASVQTVLLCLLALFLGYSPILKSRLLSRNDMSYGLYLYHMLIVTSLMNVQQPDRARWLLIIILGGGMIFGLLSWKLVEQPFMRLARREQAITTRPPLKRFDQNSVAEQETF